MRVGNLVKINRPSIGISRDAIGLIIKEHVRDQSGTAPYSIWEVTIYGATYRMLRNRRYVTQDLEVING